MPPRSVVDTRLFWWVSSDPCESSEENQYASGAVTMLLSAPSREFERSRSEPASRLVRAYGWLLLLAVTLDCLGVRIGSGIEQAAGGGEVHACQIVPRHLKNYNYATATPSRRRTLVFSSSI